MSRTNSKTEIPQLTTLPKIYWGSAVLADRPVQSARKLWKKISNVSLIGVLKRLNMEKYPENFGKYLQEQKHRKEVFDRKFESSSIVFRDSFQR